MNKGRRIGLAWLGIVAIAISLVALCLTLFRVDPTTCDWMGVIVGALAVLVTTLIGWQIYTLIDIRKIHNEVARGRDEVNYESARNMARTALAISDYFYSNLAGKEQPYHQRLYAYIQYRVLSLVNLSRIDDFKSCAAVVAFLKETVCPVNMTFSSFERKNLFDLLSTANKPQLIEGFPDLLALFASVKVVEREQGQ